MHMSWPHRGRLEKRRAHDADDAGRTGAGWRNARQLMHMMLAAQGPAGETQGS